MPKRIQEWARSLKPPRIRGGGSGGGGGLGGGFWNNLLNYRQATCCIRRGIILCYYIALCWQISVFALAYYWEDLNVIYLGG